MNDVRLYMRDMLPIIREKLNNNGSVSIRVTGQSMQPMIYHMRDSVTISQAPERLRLYDVPLYQRDDGSVILHRIVKVNEDNTYVCCGDNQWKKEYGVRQDQIIGILTSFDRNGKKVDPKKSVGYKLYVYTWPLMHHFKFLYKYLVLPFKKGGKK